MYSEDHTKDGVLVKKTYYIYGNSVRVYWKLYIEINGVLRAIRDPSSLSGYLEIKTEHEAIYKAHIARNQAILKQLHLSGKLASFN